MHAMDGKASTYDREAAERALRASESRYRSLVEATGAILGIADAGGGIVDAPKWQEFTGQTPEQYRGLGFLDAIHPEDRAAAAAEWMRAVRERGVGAAECRVRRRDGAYRWVHGQVVPVRDAAGVIREWLVAVVDIDDTRRSRELLQASETRLRRIVDSNVIGVVFWTEEGSIPDANDAFLEMAGRTREELRAGALDWRELVAPGYMVRHLEGIEEIRSTGTSTPIESEVLRPDGSRIAILCAGTSLGENPLHGVTWVVDITEKKRAESERERLLGLAEQALAKAAAASEAKDHFLAVLAHELRNPLAAVRNAVEVARHDAAGRERALEIGMRQVDQLTRLIDDLLDVARITHDRMILRKERVGLAGVARRAVETAEEAMASRSHALRVSIPDKAVEVEADPARLEQVLVNLLDNAAKYTEPGGTIELAVDPHGSEVLIRVRDSGIGIEPPLLGRVFEPFARAERSPDPARSGLGIGLTLVRRIVELHGGAVEAESEGPGKGSEFRVRLPAAAPAAPPAPAAVATRGAPRRIVVVEDNLDAAESLRMLLQLHGHEVRVAFEAGAALEVAATEPPELMLVDIGLPGMDGYEMARRARRDPRLRDVVLVALTGYGRAEDKQRALAAGFDHHLTKPIDLARLDALAAELVRGPR